jgi:hypothetical protein
MATEPLDIPRGMRRIYRRFAHWRSAHPRVRLPIPPAIVESGGAGGTRVRCLSPPCSPSPNKPTPTGSIQFGESVTNLIDVPCDRPADLLLPRCSAPLRRYCPMKMGNGRIL